MHAAGTPTAEDVRRGFTEHGRDRLVGAGKLTAFGRLSDSTMALQEFDGTNWSTSSIPFAICTSSVGATTSGSNTYAFVKSNNGGFWWNQRTNGGAWSSSWTSLGGNFISDPAMATDAGGVSYRSGAAPDNAVWFCRKPGTGFTLPQSLVGNIDSDPSAVNDATGLYVFARVPTGRSGTGASSTAAPVRGPRSAAP